MSCNCEQTKGTAVICDALSVHAACRDRACIENCALVMLGLERLLRLKYPAVSAVVEVQTNMDTGG